MIQIEKGIPLPPPRGSHQSVRGILARMEIGDSAFFPGATSHKLGGSATQLRPAKFAFRKDEVEGVTGCRAWRTS